MTEEPGQIPLLMRSEDLATWANWLSRPETAALEQLLRGQVPEHSRAHWVDGRLVGAIVAEIVMLSGVSEMAAHKSKSIL